MGKLSGGCKDQGCLDSGPLPTPLDLVACSEGLKNTDYVAMTPEVVFFCKLTVDEH